MKNNAKQIHNQCQLKYKKSPYIATINNILLNLKKIIADYMKYNYRRNLIGGNHLNLYIYRFY